MKLKYLLSSLLLIIPNLLTGCNETDLSAKGFPIPHFDANREDETYETSLFYRNDLTIFGGDSDVIYVPKERDPIYGGYFYQYTSGNFLSTQWLETNQSFAFSCLRSKDLNNWTMCGAVDNGYAVRFQQGDWVVRDCWAPEAEYDPLTNHYYIFFSARTYRFNVGGHSDIDFDRTNFHFALAASETPVGPFKLVTADDYYSWKNVTPERNSDGLALNLNNETVTSDHPLFDIAKHFGLNYPWGVIDITPFIDDDGTLYLYFSKHWTNEDWDLIRTNDYTYNCLSIWCIKMKDWITPDYDSLRMVAYPSNKSVFYKGIGPIHDDSSYTIVPFDEWDEGYGEDDGRLNEGAQVVSHVSEDGKKRYYLTYSQTGYAQRNYGCYQAISENPFGPFIKIGRNRAAIGVNQSNDYMTGVGHHAYCQAGDELFCIYWVHADPNDTSTSGNNGRIYAFDKTNYIYDDDLGFDILYTNGPTKSLQPLPEVVSGYKNIAQDAKITATNCDDSSIHFLNDGYITFLDYYINNEFVAKGKTTITLTFDEPRIIRSVMVYNSADYQYAFSKINLIDFELSERPEWYADEQYNGYGYIYNIGFKNDYYNQNAKTMRQGGSSTVSFNEIKVKSIQIEISETLSQNSQINVSEIYVLGR